MFKVTKCKRNNRTIGVAKRNLYNRMRRVRNNVKGIITEVTGIIIKVSEHVAQRYKSSLSHYAAKLIEVTKCKRNIKNRN